MTVRWRLIDVPAHRAHTDYNSADFRTGERTAVRSSYNGVPIPADGEPIRFDGQAFQVPDRPIIPFIEGDGTGRDIWRAARRVFDAAVERAYGGRRRIAWFEVFAGEKAFNRLGT